MTQTNKNPAVAGQASRVARLASRAIQAGYRVTPVYPSGALGAYKNGARITRIYHMKGGKGPAMSGLYWGVPCCLTMTVTSPIRFAPSIRWGSF